MAFTVEGTERAGRWLVTVDHATNRVPADIGGGSLGISDQDMARHIAYDVGALGLARALGHLLDSPVIASDFSRLVIDPNRGEDDPTLLMKLYDGSVIPANRSADAAETTRRLAAYHRPYHAAYAKLAASDPAIVAIHSFTPQLVGRPKRPWNIGILFADDRRLADPVIARLQARGDLTVGINEPYDGHLPGDSIDRHALRQGRLNILIEVRNDLIETSKDQEVWAALLAPLLQSALAEVQSYPPSQG